MKYGLVMFNKTQNLGDDIQSYAAYKLLPKVDYIIDRESLNVFVPQKNEYVKAIISGWYVHNIYSLPPSPFIDPLLISLHFTDHLTGKRPEYLNGLLLDYLKSYGPVGLRDSLLKSEFDKSGIDNYFSGCLTLTLKPFPNIEKTDNICIVDMDDEFVEKLRKTGKNIVTKTHKIDSDKYSKLSWQDRMNNVENQLKFYQSCSCVISNRLHVVLPCLALKVPVMLIYDKNNRDMVNRLSDYISFLNTSTRSEFLKNPSFDFENSNDYNRLTSSLKKRVSKFLEKDIPKYKDDTIKYMEYFVKQKQYQDFLVDEVLKKVNKTIKKANKTIEDKDCVLLSQEKRINELVRTSNKYSLILKELEEEYKMVLEAIDKHYTPIIDNYYRIINSKGYRYLELLRKIKRKIFRK